MELVDQFVNQFDFNHIIILAQEVVLVKAHTHFHNQELQQYLGHLFGILQ